jgi:CubicO group peptidase (beta-lactamase class C family)
MPELLSEVLWSRLGVEYDADFAVDPAGAAMHDGGLSTTLRDLARFGQMLLQDGAALDGTQVVPARWIEDSYAGGPDSREAFAASPTDTRMPGGMYRNQFWFPFPGRRLLLCLGIHGQLVYVNPDAEVVGVKVSSWEYPQYAALQQALLSALSSRPTPEALVDTLLRPPLYNTAYGRGRRDAGTSSRASEPGTRARRCARSRRLRSAR